MYLMACLSKGNIMSLSWYLFKFRSTVRWAYLSATQTGRWAVPRGHVQVSAEFGNVQSFVITVDMVSKWHLFNDIKCVLGASCRLPKQFQKAKDLSQDHPTSDLDHHENKMLWRSWTTQFACLIPLFSYHISNVYYSLRLQELFSVVLNLFLVYISICMAVFETDSYCAGYCAQKNVFKGLVVKTRDNRRI